MDNKHHEQVEHPWSVPVVVADLPDEGAHFEIAADETERAKVAKHAGLNALPRLAATFDVVRRGGGVHVSGQVTAKAGQTCVVTLAPVESKIDEAVDLDYAPDIEAADVKTKGSGQISKKHAEPPEPLVDGVIDLGAVATEFLILGLDPYPRAPGATFDLPVEEEARPNPFAALESLKKPPQ